MFCNEAWKSLNLIQINLDLEQKKTQLAWDGSPKKTRVNVTQRWSPALVFLRSQTIVNRLVNCWRCHPASKPEISRCECKHSDHKAFPTLHKPFLSSPSGFVFPFRYRIKYDSVWRMITLLGRYLQSQRHFSLRGLRNMIYRVDVCVK